MKRVEDKRKPAVSNLLNATTNRDECNVMNRLQTKWYTHLIHHLVPHKMYMLVDPFYIPLLLTSLHGCISVDIAFNQCTHNQ